MTSRIQLAIAAAAWVALWAPEVRAACATQPPPEGLVERCHDHEVTVPDSYDEFEDAIRAWIATCVSRSRAAKLVDGDPSLSEIWDWIGEHAGQQFRILPEYEPSSWTDDEGRTCYGVAEVSFRLDRPTGEVELGEEDEMELEPGPTEDQVSEAARRARRALEDRDGEGAAISRLRCVLDKMESAGKSFDGVYYPVAPGKDLVGDWNPPACYKEGRYGPDGYNQHCRSGPDALATCRRNLTDRLVDRVERGDDDDAIADFLLIVDSDVNRGVVHLRSMQDSGSKALICQGVRTHVMPDIAARAGKEALYACY